MKTKGRIEEKCAALSLTRLASSRLRVTDLVPEKNSRKIALTLVQLSRSVFGSGYIIFIEVMALW